MNVPFLLKPLPTHFHNPLANLACVVSSYYCGVLMVMFCFSHSTFINWNSSVKKGYCFWIYVFNYNKIFGINSNLELKDVNYFQLIPNINIKERKTKLVTCFRKYTGHMIYDLWIWFSF